MVFRPLYFLFFILFFLLNPAIAITVPDGFTVTQVATGIKSPTAMELAPDGRIFVAEQAGAVRVIKNGVLLTTPFATVTTDFQYERGLLGVTLDPNFTTNHYVYVYYTATTPTEHNRVSRFTANGDVAAGSETVLLDLPDINGAIWHMGGALHFGPDGMLYIGVGQHQDTSTPQNLNTPFGKILRVNPDGSIPTDNPFYNNVSGINRAIWALGFRNPYTFAFQPGTWLMYINDVGQDSWEEIDQGLAGGNYGWPLTEGYTSNPAFISPVFAYPHGSGDAYGNAITGGAFYSPKNNQFPSQYIGHYFFQDYVNGWIHEINPQTLAVTSFASGVSYCNDLRVSDDGSIFFLSRDAYASGNGTIFRIDYTANPAPTIGINPANQRIGLTQSATFTVGASGSAPLSYQWQRNGVNIPGATDSSYTLTNATLNDNGVQFRSVVNNSAGTAVSTAATLTVLNDHAPVPTINTPVNGTLYNAGDTISFSGGAQDAEEGALPAASLTWDVQLHHHTHFHPFMAPTSGITSGTFVIPTTGETSDDVSYRITLTATDSQGLSQSTYRDVFPHKSNLTFLTNPSGFSISLDGQPQSTPISTLGVVGIIRTLSADTYQALNGSLYHFSSWSDGGAQTHNISTPATNTTYTATYQQSPGGVGGAVREYWVDIGGTSVSSIPVNYTPTGTDIVTSFEGPSNWGFNYGSRVRAILHPPSTGNYTFWIASDDNSQLWLSSDSTPSNKTLIAQVSNYTNPRQWNQFPEQQSASIPLVGGQLYYIESLQKQGLGADHLSVAWQGPGITQQIIAGQYLSPYSPSGTSTPPSGNSVYLSDLTPTYSTNGWGPMEKDMSNGESSSGDGHTITLNGTTYAKGLGVHAYSEIRYTLNGAYSTFQSDIGVDDEVGNNGSVIFQVWADGVKLYDSGVMTGSSPTQSVNINVSGKNVLQLIVTDAGNGNGYDHADWAGARINPTSSTQYVSDLTPTLSTNGWGPVEKDMSNGESASGDGHTITLNGTIYAKGLGVHANSEVDYALNGVYSTFQSDIGVDDEVGSNGSVVFQVWADGVKLYDSGVMTGSSPTQSINVSVAGKNQLKLIVTDAGNGNGYDHADWAGAQLSKNSTTTVAQYLSDLPITSVTNGWGPMEKDMSNGESASGDGHTITLNGITYAKGLGVHANSEVDFALNGSYSTFKSDIGVDDEVGSNGSVIFQVWADGVKIYDSGVMTGSSPTQSINVSVSGKSQLKLIVTDAGNGNGYDHADWAGAQLFP